MPSWQFVPVNFNGGSSHGTGDPMKSARHGKDGGQAGSPDTAKTDGPKATTTVGSPATTAAT